MAEILQFTGYFSSHSHFGKILNSILRVGSPLKLLIVIREVCQDIGLTVTSVVRKLLPLNFWRSNVRLSFPRYE